MRKDWTLIAALGIALGAAGCDDTWRGLKKDTKENTEAAKEKAHETGLDKAAEEAKVKAKEAAEAAKRGIENVARDIADGRDTKKSGQNAPAEPNGENGAERAAGKVQARLQETGREIAEGAKGIGVHINVKQALMRDQAVDSTQINVDVDNDARLIVLRGTVPTIAQKAAAERTARAHSSGYAVRNELTIAPAPAR
jgi:osmotically-inducible protein OsmY